MDILKNNCLVEKKTDFINAFRPLVLIEKSTYPPTTRSDKAGFVYDCIGRWSLVENENGTDIIVLTTIGTKGTPKRPLLSVHMLPLIICSNAQKTFAGETYLRLAYVHNASTSSHACTKVAAAWVNERTIQRLNTMSRWGRLV